MLRIATILCLLWTGLTAQAEWWQNAPQSARDTIRAVYERNLEYDMGYTLAAFCAIESGGGRWLLATGGKERSGGYYHQNGRFVAARVFDIPADSVTSWQIDRTLELLITDREFDDAHARAKIKELSGYDGRDWLAVWIGWNSRKMGQAERVRQWVRFFRYQLGWRE